MKTTKKLILATFCVLSFMYIHAQTKTVEFDWSKKDFTENKSKFPFDEPFVFKVLHLNKGQKVCILIKDITKGIEYTDTLVLIVNNKVVDESGEISEVISKYLLPNHYFKVNIETNEEINLTSDEKELLVDKMSKDPALFNRLSRILFDSLYFDLHIESFNRVYSDYLKEQGIQNFRIDYKNIDEKDKQLQRIGEAGAALIQVALKLKSLNESMQKFMPSKASEVDSFFKNLYIKKADNLYYLNLQNGETLDKYIERNNLKDLNTAFFEKFKNDIAKTEKKSKIESKINNEIKAANNGLQKIQITLDSWIIDNLNPVIVNHFFLITALGSNVYDNDTEAGIYTSQTFGYGYSPNTDNGLTYFSFGFFVRPVNNSVPLSNVKGKGWWKVRFCANIGLTLEDMTSNRNGEISGLGSVFGNKAGLAGIGFRPWSFLKIDANSLFYYLKNSNPLITNKKFVASPFFGVSVNLNLVKLLSGQPNSLTTLQDKIKPSNQ